MTKTLLLSAIASTMIMAGGDIVQPVEPVAEPVVEEKTSGWEFGGQAVLYYQTSSDITVPFFLAPATEDLFSQENSAATAGIQLSAVNKNLIGNLGFGVELSGLGTLGLEEDIVYNTVQKAGSDLTAGAITQAYLTYGMGDTTLKLGRQNLPKELSPFAYSEGWNVFKNSFEALLIVNSSLPNTTLVGAYVTRANGIGNLSSFSDINEDGIWMVTAQNKSVENLTLTGTVYYGSDFVGGEGTTALWGDAKFKVAGFNVAVQGGAMLGDGFVEETTAFGAQIGRTFGDFDASIAYSSVNDGDVPIHNLATGIKSPLYTQIILNQGLIKKDSDTFVLRAGMKALGGNYGKMMKEMLTV